MMMGQTFKCHQKYSRKDILMVSEDQIKFSLCLELMDKLNDAKVIKYSFDPDKCNENIIAIASIEIITPMNI